MLDPRIYRTGFVAVAVAAVVLAFSLRAQQGPLTTTLDPGAFNGDNAVSLSSQLAAAYPERRPGSPGDDALAGQVAQTFGRYGFAVSTDTATARTVDGTRTLETVTGTRPGLGGGSIVVIAHRDSLSSPATVELSATATLLELARVLSGETHQRTIVLASTSGSAGAAGALALSKQLGGGIDAVIALGDMGGAQLRNPLIVPWADGVQVAPPSLRNTVASALGAQAALTPGGTSLAGQLVHLAFPLTLSEQGPFGARGIPAVLLSASGERGPDPNASLNPGRTAAFGRTLLQSVNALDSGPGVQRASAYLLFDSKVVPAWAVSLLVLALIVPVAVATIDGVARARRRRHPVASWAAWTLLAAIPFALAVLVAIGARLIGWISAAPPEPVASGAVRLGGGGVTLLVVLGCLLAASLAGLRWLRPAADEGTGPAVLLVLCAVALALWLTNPFAALLLIPALHLWMWLLDPEVHLRRAATITLLLVGLAPPALVILYYAVTLGLSPIGVLWNGLLMIAGGSVSLLGALEWSVVLGCVVSVIVIATRGVEAERDEPVTIRGPITYAGPGSLGGTESALRR